VDVRKLRHFVMLAETLNFREAAERSYLTQPALSRSIAALERELGVVLFDRDPWHVALTERGEELVERARRLLFQADELAAAARAPRAARRQALRVASYGSLAELERPIFAAFRERYPEVDLCVLAADQVRGLDPVLAGEYDVGLVRAPCPIPGVTMVGLFREPTMLFVPDGHPVADERSVMMADVGDSPAVTFPPRIPQPWGRYWLGAHGERGPQLRVGTYGRSPLEIMSAVAYRDMVAVLPASAARVDARPDVRPIVLDDLPSTVAAAVFSATDPPPLAECFAEVARRTAARRLSLVAGAEPLS
jgi:DNA-binding transcriptional LysR family regulator